MQMQISPSILSADFANLEKELGSISNADMVHVDVMDGHFVPNLTIGIPVVKSIRRATVLPLDLHLMIDEPESWVERYGELGVDSITFHLEATERPSETIALIRKSGARVGLAIKPATGITDVKPFLREIDMLLVMTVEPGFGGQALIPECVSKVREARDLATAEGLELEIQVDGGVTSSNIKSLAEAGANVFVAGTAVFDAPDRAARIDELRQLATTLK
jgi:ribulose-phosphate 3-epimerase